MKEEGIANAHSKMDASSPIATNNTNIDGAVLNLKVICLGNTIQNTHLHAHIMLLLSIQRHSVIYSCLFISKGDIKIVNYH